ncbi:hypothetical protein BKH46_08360 [Helicobacter sp. 12S02634-8]|uniref:hypothetical protein n=1 Tax=Helicobacter sp. 12S02634-8 TaxID=1476199 RepID=UPI000BA7C347|nr:hypothetical protein [Helicobacter sp. 12S02634-8]PAF46243.1 hypothetical protein BKH46_08360 [Helicobacter sp. 12S02634-8]
METNYTFELAIQKSPIGYDRKGNIIYAGDCVMVVDERGGMKKVLVFDLSGEPCYIEYKDLSTPYFELKKINRNNFMLQCVDEDTFCSVYNPLEIAPLPVFPDLLDNKSNRDLRGKKKPQQGNRNEI